MSFVGLHIHSDYSLLDGASQLPELADRAVELGMPAIALTDHGVMYGAIELIKVCKARKIKPIIGNEMYVVDGNIHEQKRRQKFHQVVLAKNTQGYKNLVKLTTISHLEGFQGRGIFARPCINRELLKQYREGLIVTSACLGGEIPQAIMAGKLEHARKAARWYKDVFGADFYLEIQDHGSQEDRIVNVEIVRIAEELGIKIIATNDSHFISCEDVEAHDALLCIQTGKLITEDSRMRYSGTEYLKSAAEMAMLFQDHLPEAVIRTAIANTLEVADKIEPYNVLGEPRIPDFPIPSGHTPSTYVEEIARAGLQDLLKVNNYADIDPEYQERLDYELKMIEQMGFSTYFLVVWDYIKFARDQGIPVGPGRGSAAGSLVAYTMRITNIDPVHHGLLFERFLNPERKSMPDIDTDFCIERRDEVIQYVTKKYGTERVAQIITFNRMTSKAVLKDVARVLDINYGDSDKMTKFIPTVRGKPTKLAVMISDKTPSPDFKAAYDSNRIFETKTPGAGVPAQQWIDMAMRIEGTNKTFGVHAAGVVISAQPLDEIVPLQRNNDGSVITQYYMEDLDALGLLKMDFLGLRNLTIIQNALDLIKLNQGDDIHPDEITYEERRSISILNKNGTKSKKRPPQVERTYQAIEAGDLEGVFQLESSGMLDVVSKLKPSCIEDLSSILALYRPGPLDAGLIPHFIDRKHGREAIVYDHPLLEPILEETYGTLCYQEQIMRMAQDLAGYSLGQADLLRRAMSKKKADEMQKQRTTFVDGSAKNDISSEIANKLFDQMVLFAEYCFNKSHSTAYAYVTYQTAFLKANYPVEYMAALLTANSGDQDKVTKYLNNCEKTLRIKVEPPDINRSNINFTPVKGQKSIFFGLSAIKNVGEGAIETILTERAIGGEFQSLADLCQRINMQAVNSRNLESLIKCGAFDNIEPNRQQLIQDMELTVPWAQKRAKEKEIGQGNLFDLMGSTPKSADNSFEAAPKAPTTADFSSQERLQFELELLGVYVSDHPLKSAENIVRHQGIATVNLHEIDQHVRKGLIKVVVMLQEIKIAQTKKDNKSMAILKVSSIDGTQVSAVAFSDAYEKVKNLLAINVPIVMEGKANRRDEELQIVVESIAVIDLSLDLGEEEITGDKIALVHIPIEMLQDQRQIQQLQMILEEYAGTDSNIAKTPVYALIASTTSQRLVKFGERFALESEDKAVARISHLGFTAKIRPRPPELPPVLAPQLLTSIEA